MNGKRSMMKSLALAALMLSVLTACSGLPEGAAKARIDAMQPHIGPCAASLAGKDISQARADCIALIVIADGA